MKGRKYTNFNMLATHEQLSKLESQINAILADVNWVSEPDVLRYNVLLAVHEACANIVDHAYDYTNHKEAEQIHITLQRACNPCRLIVELEDNGRSFDLTAVSEPNLDELHESGYGLFLIHQLMDEVTYTSLSNRNYWRLIKYL